MVETYLNFLKGAVEHCNEHIQQDYHHDNIVHPIQNVANILNEFMLNVNDHRFYFWQAKDGPK